ncbi:hypothetical protein Sa4125_17640 [Aureimonas sp. SA4125]|nr:hypothetical protein Sa4125_17640 [Aureimonas sp. SA4125]
MLLVDAREPIWFKSGKPTGWWFGQRVRRDFMLDIISDPHFNCASGMLRQARVSIPQLAEEGRLAIAEIRGALNANCLHPGGE